jgi:cyclic pyranopterin phosphate synthase
MRNDGIRMADITKKAVTSREAVAQARISLAPKTIKLITDKKLFKGDALNVAKCAGFLAAKKVDELIPLCHPLPLEHIEINYKVERDGIVITARCRTSAKTGVEMEAMAASCISALAIYDMCKSVDRGAVIGHIRLIEKRGGKSGHYKRK